ncbi:MAG: antibiotic biosynthesis monooxygenase [Propionibacteriaceae bacterium]|jgi:quinol monooxygenase YgiN|nr:antibiotic biosynthesis monooxygenase [Propionibacteriaceae bacterium]
MTVVVTAIFYPKPGKKQELVAALAKAIPAVHAQDAGCRLYAIHDAADGTITMIEKWDSAELLQTHSKSAATAALNAAIAEVIAKPTLVTKMEPIPAGTAEQGLL